MVAWLGLGGPEKAENGCTKVIRTNVCTRISETNLKNIVLNAGTIRLAIDIGVGLSQIFDFKNFVLSSIPIAIQAFANASFGYFCSQISTVVQSCRVHS